MNRLYMKRAIGLALLRRPWASRLALAWGLRRALRVARADGRLTFLGGLGLGAGLMYWLAGRGEPARRATRPRSPATAPSRTARAQASRRPRPAARSKSSTR